MSRMMKRSLSRAGRRDFGSDGHEVFRRVSRTLYQSALLANIGHRIIVAAGKRYPLPLPICLDGYSSLSSFQGSICSPLAMRAMLSIEMLRSRALQH
jgi:hypothetical protein